MARYSPPRTIPFALVLIIVAVAIAALVSVTRAIFFSGSAPSPLDTSQQALLDTSVDHSVSLTIRGPIVADENFHTAVIKVAPNSRQFDTYGGYMQQQVIKSVSLGNNIPAYEQFVYALNYANLVKGIEPVGAKNDTRGICATGTLYKFEVLVAGKSVKTLWTTTCRASTGTLDGDVKQLTKLFIVQIPDGGSMLSSVSL